MNKKGVTQMMLYVIIELIILAAVFFFLMWEVNMLAKNTSFEKRVIAIESTLLADAIQAAPGNVHATYDANSPEPFEMIFITKGMPFARVSEKKDKKNYKQFPFALDKNNFYSLSDSDLSQQVLFSKQDKEFKISNKHDFFPEALSCPITYTKEVVNDKTVVIEPGYSTGQSDEVTKKLENAAANIRGPFGKGKIVEDLSYSGAVENQINDAKPELLIILSSVSKTDSKNTAKAFIPNENDAKTRKIACYILNSLLRNKNIPTPSGLSVIPTSSNAILNQNKLSVLIEFGNDLETQAKLLVNPIYIGEAISAALINYYG